MQAGKSLVARRCHPHTHVACRVELLIRSQDSLGLGTPNRIKLWRKVEFEMYAILSHEGLHIIGMSVEYGY
jgi:hypothetical protein